MQDEISTFHILFGEFRKLAQRWKNVGGKRQENLCRFYIVFSSTLVYKYYIVNLNA